MIRATLALILLSALFGMSDTPRTERPSSRTVELTVTVTDFDGSPVSKLGIGAFSDATNSGAVTDNQGVAVLSLSVLDKDVRAAVRLEGGHGDDFKKLAQLTSTRIIEQAYWVDIPKTVSKVNVAVKFGKAVSVCGRVVDDQGQPLRTNAFVQGQHAMSIGRSDGRFSLPIRPATISDLYFLFDKGSYHVLTIPASKADVDVGDVHVSRLIAADSTVRVLLADGNRLPWTNEDRGTSIAMISLDGRTIQGFLVKNGLSLGNFGTGELPKVSAGSYYVTPGGFGNTPSYKVLDLIRAGRQADLDKAGVPKITAVAGKETSLTINLPEAEAVFDKLPVVAPPAAPVAPPNK